MFVMSYPPLYFFSLFKGSTLTVSSDCLATFSTSIKFLPEKTTKVLVTLLYYNFFLLKKNQNLHGIKFIINKDFRWFSCYLIDAVRI